MSTDTIGSGKDHTTLADWYAAIPATLTEVEVGLMTGTFTITADLTFNGKVTTGYSITLKPDTGQSFRDSQNDAGFKLQYSESQGTAINTSTNYVEVTISDENFIFEQIQMKTNTSQYTTWMLQVTVDNVTVESCIFDQNGYTGYRIVEVTGAGGSKTNTKIKNCLGIERGNSDTGFMAESDCEFHHNTCIHIGADSADEGYSYNGGTANVLKNCCSFGWTNFHVTGGWASESDYNATDDTAAEGSNSLTSLTFANQFRSTTDDFRVALTGSGLDAAGIQDAEVTTDILGNTRADPPCIGCHELIAAFIPRKPFVVSRAVQRASNW